MQIKKHIQNARSIRFWQDVILSLLWIGIIGSLLFLIGIELETVFYFLPEIKVKILILICGLFSGYVFFWLIQYFRAESDQIHSYKIETLALQLGRAAFPEKQDTILNALQLESSSVKNESEDLAKLYINKISKKLKNLDYSSLLKDEQLDSLKLGLLGTWIVLILIFSMNYQETGDAFYRWSTPTTEFQTPKPFSLTSISGDIHILGGEKAEIKILANGGETRYSFTTINT